MNIVACDPIMNVGMHLNILDKYSSKLEKAMIRQRDRREYFHA